MNAPDRFVEARKLILSPNEAERREGLELFEQAKANTPYAILFPLLTNGGSSHWLVQWAYYEHRQHG